MVKLLLVMRGIERVALSFGLSIAVVPLIELILNYMLWGITLQSVLYSIAIFTPAMSTIGWLRRKRLPEQERVDIEFQLKLPGWGGSTLKIALLYLAAIATAELITAVVNPLGGIILHIMLLLGLVSHASFSANNPQHKLYLVLAL